MSSSLLPAYRRLRDLEPELFELPPLLLLPYLDELPLLALLFLIPCYLLWKVGVRHYRSTGS